MSEIHQPPWDKTPINRLGLYDPFFEKDECGVGAIAHLKAEPSHQLLLDAKEILIRLSHRGGESNTANDGDGAGVMCSIPHEFFKSIFPHLPPLGEYGVGNLFLPKNEEKRLHVIKLFTELANRLGLTILHWRHPIDTNPDILGVNALDTEPFISQVFVADSRLYGEKIPAFIPVSSAEDLSDHEVVPRHRDRYYSKRTKVHRSRPDKDYVSNLSLEKRLFILRKTASHREKTFLYICSLSSNRIVYKGQLKADQLFVYFRDLSNIQFKSYFALVHSRFSTNSFPSWSRAQPFRSLCHNGEINTVSGNINMLQCRERNLENDLNSTWRSILPIHEKLGSDSSALDNVVEFLTNFDDVSYDILEAILMLIPESLSVLSNRSNSGDIESMMRHFSCVMEPWDGPALVAFCDGQTLGAVLDRNGLRPARYSVTSDDIFILSSETGVYRLNSDESKSVINEKGRLSPGAMLSIDFSQGKLFLDHRVKENIHFKLSKHINFRASTEKLIYPKNNNFNFDLNEFDITSPTVLIQQLTLFGYTAETIEHVLTPMARVRQDGLGSMGKDTPLAYLSKLPQPIANYFHQLFSQATNPSIDPLREALVMSLSCPIGREWVSLKNVRNDSFSTCSRIWLESPILSPEQFDWLFDLPSGDQTELNCNQEIAIIDITFDFNSIDYKKDRNNRLQHRSGLKKLHSKTRLEERIENLCEEAAAAIRSDGATILILSHRYAGSDRIPIDSLLAVGALNSFLVRQGLRTDVAIIAEVGDAYSVHQMSALLAFGADAIYPYMCYISLVIIVNQKLHGSKQNTSGKSSMTRGSTMSRPDTSTLCLSLNELKIAISNYQSACHAGILKVMCKLGISCLQSYKGSALMQSVGLDSDVLNLSFPTAPHSVEAVGFDKIEADARHLHSIAYSSRSIPPALLDGETVVQLRDVGEFYFRCVGDTELHLNAPDVVAKLQKSTKQKNHILYREFEENQNALSKNITVRGQFEFREYHRHDDLLSENIEDRRPLDISFLSSDYNADEREEDLLEKFVEPAVDIVKRFCTGAISLGAISDESHLTLAKAMNTIGGRSNTGEGGEEKRRFGKDNLKRSKIKQVASGRFGVSIEYLADADEIQIKLAQGAKPGEGGELPGYKVIGKIAKTRNSTPGVGLISPPPHHDMYSIEDVAQLISDLRHCNPTARISAKLVSRAGVGIIAAGIVKAKVDHLVIAGCDGGTGASKWTSIRHAGLPWEIGISETHQTLCLNNMRNDVILQVDGQLRTARDVVIAAMLGADEFAFSTAPMIAMGCIMMRKCHLNTCPVGIATQDPELIKKFDGAPEHVINYFFLLAEEIRRLLYSMGFCKMSQIIGRSDLLYPRRFKQLMMDKTKLLGEGETTTTSTTKSLKHYEDSCDYSDVLFNMNEQYYNKTTSISISDESNSPNTLSIDSIEDVSETTSQFLQSAIPASSTTSERSVAKYREIDFKNKQFQKNLHEVINDKFKNWLSKIGFSKDKVNFVIDRQYRRLLIALPITNEDRTIGANLSWTILNTGWLKSIEDQISHPKFSPYCGIKFKGSAGQSFGAWLIRGVEFELEGDCNDYVGKGLSGGHIVIYPNRRTEVSSSFQSHENVIVGNACLYGGISGLVFISGMAAERFAVRNSGVRAVVEGVGAHGCEYMTKGLIVILGDIGPNFGAGMSGGIVYILNLKSDHLVNQSSICLERVESHEDCRILFDLVYEHYRRTQSDIAKELLFHSTNTLNIETLRNSFPYDQFTKVFPHEYRKVLKEAIVEHVKTDSKVANFILREFDDLRKFGNIVNLSDCGGDQLSTNLSSGKYYQWLNVETTFQKRREETGDSKVLNKNTSHVSLSALGLGDIAPYFTDILSIENDNSPEISDEARMINLFRTGYLMWRSGKSKGASQVLGNQWEKDIKKLYPENWLKFSSLGIDIQEKKSSHRVSSVADLALLGNNQYEHTETITPPQTPSDQQEMIKNPFHRDVEDIGKNQTSRRQSTVLSGTYNRPNSVAIPDKKRGFHLYRRRDIIYRDPISRVLDWEEIIAKKNHKSRLWEQLMSTQASRCMDCGTPTCHFPNVGGGGCPLGNRIPTWNALVYEKDWKRALERLLDTNNFPEFTGTACPAPCESSCVLGINEEPVAIKSIELSIIDYAFDHGWIVPRPPTHRTYKKVAIIGSGPCGLTAAAQLNRAGHFISVFEKDDRIGGLLTYGIPNMKLDKLKKVSRRVKILKDEGIEFYTSANIENVNSLSPKYDAILIATGATKPRDLNNTPNRFKLGNIYSAMDYLKETQKLYLEGENDNSPLMGKVSSLDDGIDGDIHDPDLLEDLDEKVVIVIGGGDTAADCIATCLRLGAKKIIQFSRRPRANEELVDASIVFNIDTKTQPMKNAFTRKKYWPYVLNSSIVFHTDYAQEEVVATTTNGEDPRMYGVSTREFVPSAQDPNVVGGVKIVNVAKDATGNFCDIYNSEKVIYADLVLVAMGFTGAEELNINSTTKVPIKNGVIAAEYGDYRVSSNMPITHQGKQSHNSPIFAAGDCRIGSSLLVSAMAEGRDVAHVIDKYLMGTTVLPRCSPLQMNPTRYLRDW